MALLSATLSVGGAEAGRLEVARQEGQSVSAAIAGAKQQLIALVNAEVAKAEGAAAAAEAEKDAPDVYEENVVEGDEDAEDAARLKLPQKRKKGGGERPSGGAPAAAAKPADAGAAPMAE